MKIMELSLGGMTPQQTGMQPSPDQTAGTAPMGAAQTGMSPQQQAAKAVKDKNDRKKAINDQIVALTQQIAELRKQLADVQ
jgi:hypothetical protein